jgi:hypothetical protein
MTPAPRSYRWLALLLSISTIGCKESDQNEPDFSVPADLLPPADLALPAAEMVAPAQTLSECLALDDTHVYWADDAGPSILRVPKTGGPPELVANGGDRRGCVVLAGNRVYYTANRKSEIHQAASDGTGTPSPLAVGQNVLSRLFADTTHVYWITDVYGNVDAFSGKNAIVGVEVGVPSPQVQVLYDQVIQEPAGLYVDQDSYYYSDQTGVFRVARTGGGAPVSFGMSSIKGNEFVVAGSRLAMVEVDAVGTGGVAVMRTDGMNRIRVSNRIATTLVMDDVGLYAKQDNRLVRINLDGGGTQPITAMAPRAIALDGTHVYFSDGAAILRMKR